AALSYTWMMLWVTVLAAMLYGLLGVLTPGLLALRLVETGVGALGAALAVVFVLPVTTHSVTDHWIRRALRCVHACTAEAAARLAGSEGADPEPRIAELEQLLARVRLSDRKSTRLNSSHVKISYAVLCLKKKNNNCAGQTTKRDA